MTFGVRYVTVAVLAVITVAVALRPTAAAEAARAVVHESHQVFVGQAKPATPAGPAAKAPVFRPFDGTTGAAQQVITVLGAPGSTLATVQRYQWTAGTWQPVGAAMDAHIGASGIGPRAEYVSYTPAGTWALGQAFGRDPDTGDTLTRMPYRQLTPGTDISSMQGPTYNQWVTNPDGGLMWEGRSSWAQLGVRIDTNPSNTFGQGSGVLLHVDQQGEPTQACVGLTLADVQAVLAWLDPSEAPVMEIKTTTTLEG